MPEGAAPPKTGETSSMVPDPITPELVGKVAEKVLEMLKQDLAIERERLGVSLKPQRRKGAG